MATLLYSPGVRVLIETAREGLIEVSDDISSGSLTLNENALHTLRLSLLNHQRKYDRLFTPNDRVTVMLKRINWLRVFTGYLSGVPMFSVYPSTVPLSAECSLKSVKHTLWDPGTSVATEMLSQVSGSATFFDNDGGFHRRAQLLLNEVGGWDQKRIHIGRIPDRWFDKVSDLNDKLANRIYVTKHLLGNGPVINGQSPLTSGRTQIDGADKGWQQLPGTSGKASYFGGPGGGAYGPMNLTEEPGGNPRDPWYCAMRFPYYATHPTSGMNTRYLSATEEREAMTWWRDRKLLVVNPKNNRAVVLRAADWGPRGDLDRVIDMSQHALETVLGASTDTELEVRFAPSQAVPLGPSNATERATEGETSGRRSDNEAWYVPPGANPRSSDLAWGGFTNGKIPLTAMAVAQDGTPKQAKLYAHPEAAAAFRAMVQAAASEGVSIVASDGFRSYDLQVTTKLKKGDLAATPGTSNHGWGFAFDIDVGGFNGKVYLWMKENALHYGFVNPPWANDGKGIEEPWHWEFWGALSLKDANGGPLVAGAGGGTGPAATASNGSTVPAQSEMPAQPLNLLTASAWTPSPNPESDLLYGARRMMNDVSLLGSVSDLMNASMRSFCSAPNGDFIAWFPDYFDNYGTAAKMIVEPIELGEFNVIWNDGHMVTHQFVIGSDLGVGGPAADAYRRYTTAGVASVEFPEVLEAMLNVDPNDPASAGFMDAQAILRRFGGRTAITESQAITTEQGEFWFACYLFQRAWAQQFTATAPITFMPELFPGMLMVLPSEHIQFYVEAVTHSWNMGDGGGFTTEAHISSPSVLPGGTLYGLPRAGEGR